MRTTRSYRATLGQPMTAHTYLCINKVNPILKKKRLFSKKIYIRNTWQISKRCIWKNFMRKIYPPCCYEKVSIPQKHKRKRRWSPLSRLKKTICPLFLRIKKSTRSLFQKWKKENWPLHQEINKSASSNFQKQKSGCALVINPACVPYKLRHCLISYLIG